jgi:hypothetical protein
MESDWEIEIGGDAPVIDADWPGFVDLRVSPARVNELPETLWQGGLAEALVRLNASGSPVWTCKTDVFVPERVDPDELDAPHDAATQAVSCYIDLLMRSDQAWNLPSDAEQACRNFCALLREIRLQCCRVDFVIRKAVFEGATDLGATVYLTGCGRTLMDAETRLGECLAVFSGVIALRAQ